MAVLKRLQRYVPSVKATYYLLFVSTLIVFALAIFLQVIYHLEPCPLCILQRLFVLLLGLVCLMAALHNPKTLRGLRIYGLAVFSVALAGIAVAGRHVWLLSQPASQNVTCGPELAYLFQIMPVVDVFKVLYQGTAACVQDNFQILFFNIPQWVLGLFLFYALAAVFQFYRAK